MIFSKLRELEMRKYGAVQTSLSLTFFIHTKIIDREFKFGMEKNGNRESLDIKGRSVTLKKKKQSLYLVDALLHPQEEESRKKLHLTKACNIFLYRFSSTLDTRDSPSHLCQNHSV